MYDKFYKGHTILRLMFTLETHLLMKETWLCPISSGFIRIEFRAIMYEDNATIQGFTTRLEMLLCAWSTLPSLALI